ncbi:T9SS type A sorting domain-containing protein [candidate division KSB1 bacterium]|nr:T9SS type A sorting domain-containing protein [candidate division KSB1 bacterium]
MKKWITVLIILWGAVSWGKELYPDNAVVKMELFFEQPDFWQLLENYKDEKIYIPADLVVDGEKQMESVGVRYKGNSSYFAADKKKPLKISTDEFIDGQDLWGYDTFNLNNAFMDPTFVREKICYDIFRHYMPAGRCAFVELYINGDYWGVYNNVEEVNKDFLDEWFSSDKGNLYKGDPRGNLTWYGSDWAPYKSQYEKDTNESGDDWTDLVNFIDVLNNSANLSRDLPPLLDIDKALWYLALNNLFVNLDSYIYSGHNYYLYNDPGTQRFVLFPWDLNESFGAFPPKGLSLAQLETYSPFHHLGNPDFPLLYRLLTLPVYRAIYLAHYHTAQSRHFSVDSIMTRVNFYHTMIDSLVKRDTRKLYTYDQFLTNTTNAVVIENNRTAPGIQTLVQNRSDYLVDLDVFQDYGVEIQQLESAADLPTAGETVTYRAAISNAANVANVYFFYRIDQEQFSLTEMRDDGNHGDITAGDGIYGCEIYIKPGSAGMSLDYYCLAILDNQRGILLPELAQQEVFSEGINSNTMGKVVINEFMAGNDSTITDPQGDYEDWVELKSRSAQPVSLQGMYLSDDPADSRKWMFPDVTIPAYGYLLIWADEDVEDTPGLHTSFKLSKDGEYIGLYDDDSDDNKLIDSYTFGQIDDDVSMGRSPDGEGEFVLFTNPTPGHSNTDVTSVTDKQKKPDVFRLFPNYPNPFNAGTTFSFQLKQSAHIVLDVYDLQGRHVDELIDKRFSEGEHRFSWRGRDKKGLALPSGTYFYHFRAGQFQQSGKLVLLR